MISLKQLGLKLPPSQLYNHRRALSPSMRHVGNALKMHTSVTHEISISLSVSRFRTPQKVFVLQRLSSGEALKTLKMNDGYFFELLKMMTSGKHSKHKVPADTLPITDEAT